MPWGTTDFRAELITWEAGRNERVSQGLERNTGGLRSTLCSGGKTQSVSAGISTGDEASYEKNTDVNPAAWTYDGCGVQQRAWADERNDVTWRWCGRA